MTTPTELLRRFGAPAPLAITMKAEIRTDGSLPFHMVRPPEWGGAESFGTVFEMSAVLDWQAVAELRTFLGKPYQRTRKTPEALLHEALSALGIGTYLGTFVGRAHGGALVRIMIGYRPRPEKSLEEVNTAISRLLTAPAAEHKAASDALRTIRETWLKGAEKNQDVMMLLANVDLSDKLDQPTQFPFAAVDHKGVTRPGGRRRK